MKLEMRPQKQLCVNWLRAFWPMTRMRTVVCLTLAKWETVFGQFGGYLTVRGLSHTAVSGVWPRRLGRAWSYNTDLDIRPPLRRRSCSLIELRYLSGRNGVRR